jgi:hypothetical protein
LCGRRDRRYPHSFRRRYLLKGVVPQGGTSAGLARDGALDRRTEMAAARLAWLGMFAFIGAVGLDGYRCILRWRCVT